MDVGMRPGGCFGPMGGSLIYLTALMPGCGDRVG